MRIIRQRPLQRLHSSHGARNPDIPLFVSRQGRRHGLRMDWFQSKPGLFAGERPLTRSKRIAPRPREGARLGANASALRGNAARVRRFRGCDILVERDHRRRPVLGTRSPAIASRAVPAKSNNAARGDMVSVMAGNSPPRTDTPSDVIVAKTESDAARMSGWARALGYPDPSTRMIASATTITSTSVVSHSGMRLVGSGIASALRNPDAATESRAPI